MLNRVTIMGRLTRDPELRRTQSNIAVTSFSLAVERDFKGQDKEGGKRRSAEVVADNIYFGDSKKEPSGPPPAEQYPPAGGYGDAGYGGYTPGGYSAGGYGDSQFHELEEDDGELPF